MKQGDSGDTVAAAINAPMIVGDYLATGNGSRAEIQIDDASFVRASEDVQLRFTRMDPADHTLQLAAGTIEVSLIKVTDGRPQVETPSIRIRPEEAGSYRITVTSDGQTLLTVRSGQADLIAPQGTQTISQGVTVAIQGSSANPTFRTIQTIAYDDFDTWNADRDKFAWRAYANAYASPDIVGLADLSNYGQWVASPNYGYVWAPYNQYGWAPYSTAAGRGSTTAVGRGWVTSPGVGRRIITAAGSTRRLSAGRGILGRATIGPTGSRRSSRSSTSAAADSVSASAISAGFRWGRTSRTIGTTTSRTSPIARTSSMSRTCITSPTRTAMRAGPAA